MRVMPSPLRAAIAAACAALLTATALAPARADIDVRTQMLLGNPSGAGVVHRDNYLLLRPQLAVGYSDSLRFPRWVSWHLSARDIGDVERGQFQPDPMLPKTLGFERVTPADYTRTGYDRGHNCPSKDRSVTREDNDAVFYMTNMTPQAHGLNAGPWQELESYCRELAQQGNELYIIAGHGFTKGMPDKRVGRAGVAVPDFGWKVVVVLPERRTGDDRTRITADTRVIAVRMPNISTVSKKDWREYRISVVEIEQATGLRFFTALPAPIAGALKNKVDFDRPAPSKAGGSGGTAPGSSSGKVWVNTRSGVYWLPGTQFYGKTKQGTYMTEAEAKAAGYRKAEQR